MSLATTKMLQAVASEKIDRPRFGHCDALASIQLWLLTSERIKSTCCPTCSLQARRAWWPMYHVITPNIFLDVKQHQYYHENAQLKQQRVTALLKKKTFNIVIALVKKRVCLFCPCKNCYIISTHQCLHFKGIKCRTVYVSMVSDTQTNWLNIK